MRHQQDLADVFDFTARDLQANKGGTFSNRQMEKFVQQDRGCALVAGGAFVLVILATVFTYIADQGSFPQLLPMFVIMLVLSGIGFVAARTSLNVDHHLFHVEGQANLYMEERKRYRLNVRGYTFNVAQAEYEILEDGTHYRVYYATPEQDEEKQKTALKYIQTIEIIE
ncbi:MAG: hypothetical protein MUE40_05360 [Anaerolineae bacterium]|nr:hypothetical protein [Anaerolineae bacterium]